MTSDTPVTDQCDGCGRTVTHGRFWVVARQSDLPDGTVVCVRCRSKYPASKQYQPAEWPPENTGESL